jgi:Xaa-Pro aminopeptidase
MTLAEERRARLNAVMDQAGLDMLVVCGNGWQGDYLRYVADFGILEGQGFALVTRDGGVTLLLDAAVEAERAEVECPGIEVTWSPEILDSVEAALTRLGNRAAAMAPYGLAPKRLIERFPQDKLKDGTALFNRLLMQKSANEVAAVRRAAALADSGYAVFRDAAKPGRYDYELIAEIEAFFRSQGCPDNFQIVGCGGVEVRGMSPPEGKKLKKGDMVTTELTPCVDGYWAQICRTLVVGPPSEAQLKAFAVYREALEAGIAAVKPGNRAADVAFAENEVFRKYGLGEYVTNAYTRVRGHGIGLFVDTPPHILEDVDTELVPGMTMIVHPNTYHPEVGYLVLGDAVVVTETGCEVLCHVPRELFSVPA